MTSEIRSSNEIYWQEKYLSALAELEEQEEANKLKHEQLRRGLVMAALLAEGQTVSLDSQLKALRHAIKADNFDLTDSLDSLKKTFDHFEQSSIVQLEVLLDQINDTAQKLSLCPLPKDILKQVKGTRRTAKKELQLWSGYNSQLQKWLKIIADVADTSDGQQQSQKKWLSWLKPSQSTGSEAPQSSASDIEEQVSDLIRNVSFTVENLLDKLIIPDHLLSLKRSIQERLDQPLDWGELVPILDETANFLMQCIETSQVKIEKFLQNLDTRLQAIRALVSQASNDNGERSKAREALEALVREQLSDVHSVVTGSTDLNTIGDSVSKHLELILRAMEHYRNEEEQREKRLTEHIALLQERLTEMEDELEQSKKSFKEQKHKATIDSLTGLPNREAYQQRINDELTRFQRYGSPLSLVICDIDHFKKINDSYGHLAGDKVLQLIARLLQKNIRDTDFIARFGGEEFIILMPETTADQALVAAEKIRKLIESSPFNFRKERVSVTISIGIAEFQENETPNSAFERADIALYEVKRSGRNGSQLASTSDEDS